MKDKRAYKDRKAYQKEYYKKYYQNPVNKQKKIEQEKRQAIKNRQIYNEWKKTLYCKNCGENHPACLEFHHKNPDEKDFSVSNISGKNLKYIKKEAEKCIILCANCHRKLHNPLL